MSLEMSIAISGLALSVLAVVLSRTDRGKDAQKKEMETLWEKVDTLRGEIQDIRVHYVDRETLRSVGMELTGRIEKAIDRIDRWSEKGRQ